MARRSIVARFWDKTWKRGNSLCWPWVGYVDKQGYARFWVNQELGSVPAQRVSMILFNQDVDLHQDSKVMTCPVLKSCVNPLHVGIAGPEDIGERILWKKGLNRKKPYIAHRQLTDEEIIAIFTSEKQTNAVAEEFGLTPMRVAMIRSGKHHRKVTKGLQHESD